MKKNNCKKILPNHPHRLLFITLACLFYSYSVFAVPPLPSTTNTISTQQQFQTPAASVVAGTMQSGMTLPTPIIQNGNIQSGSIQDASILRGSLSNGTITGGTVDATALRGVTPSSSQGFTVAGWSVEGWQSQSAGRNKFNIDISGNADNATTSTYLQACNNPSQPMVFSVASGTYYPGSVFNFSGISKKPGGQLCPGSYTVTFGCWMAIPAGSTARDCDGPYCDIYFYINGSKGQLWKDENGGNGYSQSPSNYYKSGSFNWTTNDGSINNFTVTGEGGSSPPNAYIYGGGLPCTLSLNLNSPLPY